MESFDGGLNSKYEPQIISDNEAQSCANVVFDDLGGVATRQGYSVLNTGLVNSNACDGLFTANWNNGRQSMAAWFGTDMLVLSGTTFVTVPSAQGVFTTGAVKYNEMYQDLMFIGHGSTPYKYDEGVFTRHGVEVPSLVADGGTRTAGGNLIGDYHYKLTYVNTQVVEGDVSTGTATLVATGAGEQILITGIATPDQSFGVNAKYLYRTIAGSGLSGTYYFVASLAASITTYTDNIVDGSLGSAAPTDNGKPPNYKYVKTFQERLFFNDEDNPMYLWYSELGNPFTVKSTNFIKISDGDGEKITGFGVQGSSLIVFKENSVWIIYMPSTDDTGWVRLKSNSKYGCASHKSVVEYEQQLMFLGQQNKKITGFYAFAGNTTEPDVTSLRAATMFGDAKSDRIEPDTDSFQNANKDLCVGQAWENKLWFTATHGTGNTSNNRVYQFDFVRRGNSRKVGSWVPFTGMSFNDFAILDGKLYAGTSDDDGFVYQLQDGTYTDNGNAIDSFFETKEFDGGKTLRHFDKDFRQANFTLETLGNWKMRIAHRIDSEKGDGNAQTVDLNPGGSIWGTSTWGSSSWGGGKTRIDQKIELGPSEGKRVSFKFTNLNTAGNAFKVIRGNCYFNQRGLR
jgi:hypothetical protein